MPWLIYEFLDERGMGVIEEWLKKAKIQKKARALLNQKLDMLESTGPDLAPKLLAGPLEGLPIYKLRVQAAGVQLRPMLCKGPCDNDSEYTLLLGAVERDGALKPLDAVQRADENRQLVSLTPARRRIHEDHF